MVSQALRVNPRDIDARASLAAYYAKSGDRASALGQLNALPSTLDDPHVLVFGAVVYVDLADQTKALDWLEKAATHGLAASELQDWIELDALKTNPRFAALRTR
jgi:TPR repeat protein